MSNSKHDGFRSLLYYKFIHSKTHKVDETALKMGISVSTFYNYIEGINNFPVDLVPPLYNATQDIDFLNFTLNNTACAHIVVFLRQYVLLTHRHY